jgi:hypothetical protein
VVVTALLFSRKEHYTLTVTPEAIRVVDDRGKLIESLALPNLELEIACHEYAGRATMRMPVVVLREKTHELTVGGNTSEEPPPTTRRFRHHVSSSNGRSLIDRSPYRPPRRGQIVSL